MATTEPAKPKRIRKAPVKPAKKRRPHARPWGSLTVKLVSEALTLASGNQTEAAKLLKVDKSTVCRFLKAHSEMAGVKADIEEEINDLAEGVVIKALKSANENVALTAAKYWLDHKARHRGWGPKPIELGGLGGKPIEMEHRDMTKLTDAQLAALAALHDGTD